MESVDTKYGWSLALANEKELLDDGNLSKVHYNWLVQKMLAIKALTDPLMDAGMPPTYEIRHLIEKLDDVVPVDMTLPAEVLEWCDTLEA